MVSLSLSLSLSLSAVSPTDYEGVSGLVLEFNTGDNRVCHNVTIVQDQLCEDPSEDFISNLTLQSGVQPISVVRTPATVNIIDTNEPECSKPSMYYISLFHSLSLSLSLSLSSPPSPIKMR